MSKQYLNMITFCFVSMRFWYLKYEFCQDTFCVEKLFRQIGFQIFIDILPKLFNSLKHSVKNFSSIVGVDKTQTNGIKRRHLVCKLDNKKKYEIGS
ncbi:hypothetical protein BpHYR1_027721 [Brachionus plicatilis]|uniref:Uncharacterized protein n=1 Tax=Brachionus plicatilis TaxID=10195 RepID=A0A3M7SKK8_BRAPC|nr:hypothetical protein BpHYR1_027721 [Brachionus plicatilis]